MSKLSVLIVLVIAAALAVGAYFALSSSPQSTSNQPQTDGDTDAPTVLTLDPARVTTITVETGARKQRAARSGPSAWTLNTTDGWPLDPTRVSAALNSIATLQAFPTDNTDTPAPPTGDILAVTVTLDDGTTHTVTIARTAAGGRAAATIDDNTPVLLPAAALGLFDPQQGLGPEAWRITASPLPGATDNPTRIRINHNLQQTTLERTSSGWRMTEPINAPAADATEVLRAILAQIQTQGFSNARSLVPPTITVTTSGGTRSLGLANTPNLPAVATVALPNSSTNITTVIPVNLDDLLDPARFLQPNPIAAAPGDIRVLGTANNAYEQCIDGWTDDAGDTLPTPVASNINALLTAMSDGSATPLILDSPDTSNAFLTVISRTGLQLGSFAATQTEQGLRLALGRQAWLLPSIEAPWLNPAIDATTQPSPTTPSNPADNGNPLPEK